MTAEPVCLTLIAARQLREELFDYLSEQRDLVSGFTASDAAGHGPTVRLQTPAERVKGHADEVLVRINSGKARCRRDCSPGSRRRLPEPDSVYWIMPVTEFGVIDDGQDKSGI